MKNRFNSKGSALIISLLVASVAAVVCAGWNLSSANGRGENPQGEIEKYAYEGFSVKPKKGKSWWKEEEKREARKSREKRDIIKSDGDMGKKNKGLKDPDDIEWPYGADFIYKLNMRDELTEDMPPGEFFTHSARYKAGDEEGKLKDVMRMGDRSFGMDMVAEITFDEQRQVRQVALRMLMDSLPGMSASDMNMSIIFTNNGDTSEMNFKLPSSFGSERTSMPTDIEFECPLDGFFYMSGVDTPGSIALMLSAIDLSDGPVSVWTFCPSIMGMMDQIGGELQDPTDFLIYVTISELSECSEETIEWYSMTREMFKGWEPPEDTRILIFEGITDPFFLFYGEDVPMVDMAEVEELYSPDGPFLIVYLDDEERVTRIEQPGGLLTTNSELDEIDSGGGWWGKRNQGE